MKIDNVEKITTNQYVSDIFSISLSISLFRDIIEI